MLSDSRRHQRHIATARTIRKHITLIPTYFSTGLPTQMPRDFSLVTGVYSLN